VVLGTWLDEVDFKSIDIETRRRTVLLIADLDGAFASKFLGEKLEASLGRLAGLGRGKATAEWRTLAAEGLAAVGDEACLTKLRLARTRGGDEFKQLVSRLLSEKRREQIN
jgi:hypothetical protein